MKQRVLVCGGRDYWNRDQLFAALDNAHKANPITIIIHGDACGADSLAGKWARSRGIAEFRFPADWNSYGKSAGPKRNRQMLEEGRPDIVIAFKGGRGTANMRQLAENANIPVITIRSPKSQTTESTP